MPDIYRELGRKKSGNSARGAASPSRRIRDAGLVTGGAGHYVAAQVAGGCRSAVKTSFVQLVAFVVLAAVVLATGFGAIGPVAGAL